MRFPTKRRTKQRVDRQRITANRGTERQTADDRRRGGTEPATDGNLRFQYERAAEDRRDRSHGLREEIELLGHALQARERSTAVDDQWPIVRLIFGGQVTTDRETDGVEPRA